MIYFSKYFSTDLFIYLFSSVQYLLLTDLFVDSLIYHQVYVFISVMYFSSIYISSVKIVFIHL
jgi:hypothetical protein